MDFVYEGKSYSSQYIMQDDGTFVWEDNVTGKLYEELLDSKVPMHIIGEVVNFLNEEEAQKLIAEVQAIKQNAKKIEDQSGVGTKSQDIAGYRLRIYPCFNFGPSEMGSRSFLEKDINLIEDDAVTFDVIRSAPYWIRSFTMVVQRSPDFSWYTKTEARLILAGNDGAFIFFTTNEHGDSIKIPDLRAFGWDRLTYHSYVAIF